MEPNIEQTDQKEENQNKETKTLKQKMQSETNISLDSDSSQKQSTSTCNRQLNRKSSRLDFSSLFPNDLQKKISKNVEHYHEFSQSLVYSASSLSRHFSALVNTSTGREKVLAVFQYWGEFQCDLAKHSNIAQIQELYSKRMLASIRFMFVMKENLSQARKTFRLLKFLDDFKAVQRVIQTKKPFLFKFLGVLCNYFSFMYYISDNILFIMTLLIQSKILPKEREHKWKDKKNSFSLLRIVFSIIRHLWSLYMRYKKEVDIYKQISEAEEKQMTKEDKIYELCNKLIKKRRKRRFEWFEVTIDVCRFFMLYKGLKLPAYKIVDPAFIGLCGVMSSTMSLMKMIIDKKIFVSVQNTTPPQNTYTYEDQNGNKVKNIFYNIDSFSTTQNLKDFDGLVGNVYQTNSNQK
ncbi:hypothetical protein ABPG74_022748 [Tetrahymena malaccensis]